MTKRKRRWHPIGQWLRTARKDAGLTFAELERLTGVSSSSLVRFESNRAVPNFGDVCLIAQQLSWPLVYFATGRDRTGHDPAALAAQLHYWGLKDLSLPRRVLFGETRPFEELVAEAVTADPSPRVLEGIPGLLLRNKVDVAELLASARRYLGINRLGWLADVAQTVSRRIPQEYVHPDAPRQLRAVLADTEKTASPEEIDYVFGEIPSSASGQRVWSASPALTKRWRIACDISLNQFQERAISILERPERS
jgi:transcriptional regulator with XRE-family HTH domain